MDERKRRERAAFWARLASAESLDELSPAERERLLATFKDITADVSGVSQKVRWHRSPVTSGYYASENAAVVKASSVSTDEDFRKAHSFARETLLPMVRGEEVLVHVDLQEFWCITRDGEFLEMGKWTGLSNLFHNALAYVLRGSKHLFGACPQCGSVFVRVRRQRYCSPNCNAKALGEARKVEKVRYMRLYRKREQVTKRKNKKGV